MKAQPASASDPVKAEPGADVASHFPLSYEDFGTVAAVCDTCAIVTASMATGSLYHWLAFGHVGSVTGFFGVGAILAALAVALMKLRGLYTAESLLTVRSWGAPIVLIWSSVVLFLLGVSFTLKVSEELSRGSILALAITAPFLLLGQRFVLRRAMLAVLQRGWLRRSKVLLITRDQKTAVANHETMPTYDVVATYVLPRDPEGVRRMLAKIASSARGANVIDEVHFAMDWNSWAELKRVIAELRLLPIPVRLIADATAREILQYPVHRAGGLIT